MLQDAIHHRENWTVPERPRMLRFGENCIQPGQRPQQQIATSAAELDLPTALAGGVKIIESHHLEAHVSLTMLGVDVLQLGWLDGRSF